MEVAASGTPAPPARTSAVTWSPARIYLVVSGVFLLILATAGFIYERSFPTASEAVDPAHIFGIFETNGWHNLAGTLSGVVALVFASRAEWARFGALLKGVFYVAVTSALIVWDPTTFWLASNTADQVIHASSRSEGSQPGSQHDPRRVNRS